LPSFPARQMPGLTLLVIFAQTSLASALAKTPVVGRFIASILNSPVDELLIIIGQKG